MGVFSTKKLFLLLLIISTSLIPTSYAGRGSRFISTTRLMTEELMRGANKEEINSNVDEISIIHERLLRGNTHDYGRYDPPPSLPRPRHKLIPN